MPNASAMPTRALRRLRRGGRFARALVLLWAAWAGGCAGHAERTQDARTALDAGRPKAALAALNEELGVDRAEDLPAEVGADSALLILDRSMVLQALDRTDLSSRDLETADKNIEVLDFSRDALDDISKYMFSDDAGPYQAPAYEKLLINTINMVNYLARGDLGGARVEARRFAVMQKFVSEHEGHGKSLSGPGSYLSGFIFEKSNRPSEALRYYDEALQIGEFTSLTDPLRRLALQDSYRSPRIRALIGEDSALAPPPDDGSGEILVVVSYGRVPAKIAKRVPIGLALTIASGYISPHDRSRANYLAGQGLVTWVNYPTLGKPRGEYGVPHFDIDGGPRALEGMLAVDAEAVRAWKDVEGAVVASAITRMLTRVVTGEATRQATGGGVLGALVSLGTQATMTAVDTPDTRSWSTLPARIAFGRVRVAPGAHEVVLTARGTQKRQRVNVPKNGWAVVYLTALR